MGGPGKWRAGRRVAALSGARRAPAPQAEPALSWRRETMRVTAGVGLAGVEMHLETP
jgi:hypothetical protein